MVETTRVEGYIIRDSSGRHLVGDHQWCRMVHGPGGAFVHTPESLAHLLDSGVMSAWSRQPATAQRAVYENDEVRTDGRAVAFSSLLASRQLGQQFRPGDLPTVINAKYAGAYREEFDEAEQKQECPYCVDQLVRPEVILQRSACEDPNVDWFIKEITNPDWLLPARPLPEDKKVVRAEKTYLIIPCRHITWPSELTQGDFISICELVQWGRDALHIPAGALAMRIDEPEHMGRSGRTVMHLHMQWIVNPKGRIVDFPVG